MTSAREEFAALLREDFGPLLADDDVSAAHVAPDGSLTLTRRGQAEVLEAKATELVAAASAACAQGSLRCSLANADESFSVARLSVARAGKGVHLHLEKRARSRLPLRSLEEGGVLPPGFDQELLADLSGGGSLLALGPSQYAAHQLVIACADACARFAPTFVLSGHAVDEGREDLVTGAPSSLRLPPFVTASEAKIALHPTPEASTLIDAAQQSVAVGAHYLVAVDLAKEELAALLDADLPVVLLAHLRAPAFAPAQPANALAVTCTMGFGPRGEPRLAMCVRDGVEPTLARADSQSGITHAAAHARPPLSQAVPSALPTAMPAALTTSEPPAIAQPQARGGPGAELPPLQPLGPAPPSDWMSDAPEMDPGWDVKSESDLALGHLRQPPPLVDRPVEEGENAKASGPPREDPPREDPPHDDKVAANVPAEASAFAQTLENVAKRPPFQPRKPSEHPQAKKLREDPFGGLTFEPPRDPSPSRAGDDADDAPFAPPPQQDKESE